MVPSDHKEEKILLKRVWRVDYEVLKPHDSSRDVMDGYVDTRPHWHKDTCNVLAGENGLIAVEQAKAAALKCEGVMAWKLTGVNPVCDVHLPQVNV